jgi:putative transposase
MAQRLHAELPEVTLSHLCHVLGVPRASFYRAVAPAAEDHRDLVTQIETIILRNSGYGSRRVSMRILKDGGTAGRKLVQRLMRENSLLCQIKRHWIHTTDSKHAFKRHANLAKGLVTTDLNQLWVTDITYIRLPKGFCYLAVMLDAHSRKAVAWHMSMRIDAALVLDCLSKAIEARSPPAGWIHHSDQGVQYACRGYAQAVIQSGGRPSMSAKACPYDNAKAESFFATLKKEQVHKDEYPNFQQAQSAIADYIDRYYNPQRLHSQLGYCSPQEFELLQPAKEEKAKA